MQFHVDKTVESPLYRMCNVRCESVSHLVSECSKLAQREYKRRHENVARIIHWKLCKLYELDRAEKLLEHQPSSVQETDRTKVLWDFNIQCNHIIEARRPDIVIVEKEEKVCKIIDIAIPGGSRVAEKEREKVEKYQDLKREITRIWFMRKVDVIPVVVGALGKITKNLDKWIEKSGIKTKAEHLQKPAIRGTARILRKVLET